MYGLYSNIKNKVIEIYEKKGSYLVEAAIILPIFILGLIAIISVIPAISKAERVVYQACDEMRLECIKSVYINNPIALPSRIMLRCPESDKAIKNFFAYSTIYRSNSAHMDEMINLKWHTNIIQPTLSGIFDNISLNGEMIGRSFVGYERSQDPTDRSTFEENLESKPVYIFPNEGSKYHGSNCRVLNSAAKVNILTPSFKKKHKPCKLCKAKHISLSEYVYTFNNGDVRYHSTSCNLVKKRYISIDISIAKKRGYEPCKICGGHN